MNKCIQSVVKVNLLAHKISFSFLNEKRQMAYILSLVGLFRATGGQGGFRWYQVSGVWHLSGGLA